MCGITGQFTYSSQFNKPGGCSHLVTLMSRRGPDDTGEWHDDDHCWLGFRRLSILDLSSAGHQTMLTSGGGYVIVFNGELYNFRELRTELEGRGVRFRSSGDAEVALYALEEWRIKALERFNGMFALAFYDIREKRLLLAREHAMKYDWNVLKPRFLQLLHSL